MMLDPAEKRGITASQSIADAVAESIEDAEDYADGVAALERFRKHPVVWWASPDLNRGQRLPKPQVYQANPQAHWRMRILQGLKCFWSECQGYQISQGILGSSSSVRSSGSTSESVSS